MKPQVSDAPEELDFLEAFSVEASESEPVDGFWCYVFEDVGGVRVRFSFNILETSVQTVTYLEGRAVCTVVQEGADRIWLVEKNGYAAVHATFPGDEDEVDTMLQLIVRPKLEVRWTSLYS